MDFADYHDLRFERRDDGVLLITINRPERMNATDERLHTELTTVWRDIAADDATRVAVITGAGAAFSAGGDLDMLQRLAGDYGRVATMAGEAAALVLNMLDCEKPIVSAINGTAVGAGLAVALMADISIIAEDARADRRSPPPRRRRRRPRRHHLAAAVRDGEGEVLPAHRGLHRRPRGGADRPRQPLRPSERGPRHGARGRGPPRARPPARRPVDKAHAQPLAALGDSRLRRERRLRDADLPRRRRARGRGGDRRAPGGRGSPTGKTEHTDRGAPRAARRADPVVQAHISRAASPLALARAKAGSERRAVQRQPRPNRSAKLRRATVRRTQVPR